MPADTSFCLPGYCQLVFFANVKAQLLVLPERPSTPKLEEVRVDEGCGTWSILKEFEHA